MEQPSKIASFNELAPAEAVAEQLRTSGIEAHVRDESTQQQWQLWAIEPRAHMLVRVDAKDEDRGQALLKEWADAGGDAAQAVRCPECGSFQIEYPQFSRKTLLGAVPAVLATAGLIDRSFYCQLCQYTWPSEPPAAEPELDVLGWPKK